MTRFEFVSEKQYNETLNKLLCPYLGSTYDSLKLPCRATIGSAGYDFYAPFDFELEAGDSILIPTGIRVKMENGLFLMCAPRSGLGFKFRLQLDNTIGIIDSDYYNSDNEGHIMAKLTNDTHDNKTVTVKQGEAFMQGIFVQYFMTDDDFVTNKRNGGFGSTK